MLNFIPSCQTVFKVMVPFHTPSSSNTGKSQLLKVLIVVAWPSSLCSQCRHWEVKEHPILKWVFPITTPSIIFYICALRTAHSLSVVCWLHTGWDVTHTPLWKSHQLDVISTCFKQKSCFAPESWPMRSDQQHTDQDLEIPEPAIPRWHSRLEWGS